MFKNSKVVICGVGNVGATTAYTIVNQGLCEQLVLIDVRKDKAYAEALDMSHAIHFMNRNMHVWSGDYADCADADVVIITASAPMPKDSHDRLEMLRPSLSIVKSIVQSVMASGFSGIFVVISNPVDIMTYFTWKVSGMPRNQVIGSGTNLDSARLAYELGTMYDLDSKSVQAYVLGEHGDSEVISWGTAIIGGKNIDNVMGDNTDRTKDMTKEALRKKTVEAGWEIFNRKGNTSYGIAASVTAIVKSIMFNENAIYPVSVCMNGEYGIKDVFISMPTIIDSNGAREIVGIHLKDDELAALKRSAELMKAFYPQLESFYKD